LVEEQTSIRNFYFSTRDLLIMAVLAALGGVTSTYINTVSDAVHAILGFPGASQWAAGLHVIWIVLAMGITGKPGTGIITGILKGGVELMSGNSHGVIILLVDVVAGLCVDFGFLLFRNKQSLLLYMIAGGLASGSNVLVFQIFATLPQNIVAAGAIFILFIIAVASGVIFAGIIPKLLINSLTKAGIVKTPKKIIGHQKIGLVVILAVAILSGLLAIFLRTNFASGETIQITGAITNAYVFPNEEFDLEAVTREMEYRGLLTEFRGYPIIDVIEYAQPVEGADTVLLEASDGYAFLLSFEEIRENQNILIVQQGKGENTSFDIVGPESSKAWVRNTAKLTVIASEGLEIITSVGEEVTFNPDEWVVDMDSTQVALPEGSKKLQGVPLWKVIASEQPDQPISEVVLSSPEETMKMTWLEINNNDDLRIFTVIGQEDISFALAKMSGEVLLFPIREIGIQ
jgi:energy-coupling factor transport system substrate-specific component